MRVIKFRAWGKDSERMIDEPYHFEQSEDKYWCYEGWRDLEDGIRHDCELMQFTGLLDKNGKEIYEGDIVRVYTMVDVSELLFEPHEYVAQEIYCEVVYSEEIASFDLKTLQRDTYLAAWGFYGQGANDDIEVIGNIYENPDLLTRLASDAATI